MHNECRDLSPPRREVHDELVCPFCRRTNTSHVSGIAPKVRVLCDPDLGGCSAAGPREADAIRAKAKWINASQ